MRALLRKLFGLTPGFLLGLIRDGIDADNASRVCLGCDARQSEVEFLRSRLRELENTLAELAKSGGTLGSLGTTSAWRENVQVQEHDFMPLLPPAVVDAVQDMSGNDKQLEASLVRYAEKLMHEEPDTPPEDIADRIYRGGDRTVR